MRFDFGVNPAGRHRALRSFTTTPPSNPNSNSNRNPIPNATTSSGESFTGRLRSLFQKYGRTAIVVYLSISAVSITSLWMAVRSGIDVERVIDRIPILHGWLKKQPEVGDASTTPGASNASTAAALAKTDNADPRKRRAATAAGTLAIAYAIHKVLAPVRIGATLALTPPIARWLQRRRKL